MPSVGPQAKMGIRASPRNIFILTGSILLTLLCIVPIWNSVALMGDTNYTFWVGNTVPFWTIVLCLMIIALYGITIMIFFGHARPQVQTEQTIMMIANIFITLLGITLMLVALPLSRQSVETYNNLMHRCDYSDQTHRTYEYSQVLQNIRATPECASKFSVQECQGYEDAEPYTSFLKNLETNFRCSGFCYRSPQQLQAVAAPSVNGSAPSFLAEAVKSSTITRHKDTVTPLALLEQSSYSKLIKRAEPSYPPTLFTDANYKASCEGMAARDMKNFAGDIGFQTFYQGIFLIMIAIGTSFLKLLGFCVRQDRDFQYLNKGSA